jgi:predicted amidophosphoribosyltransferase
MSPHRRATPLRSLPALGAELLDLLLPVSCAGCGRSGAGCWCPACRPPPGEPRRVPLAGLPGTLAVGTYAGSLRAALLAYKERGRHELADPLAALLADRALRRAGGWSQARAGPGRAPRWWLVPAPSRASAARARGGDHMLALARRTAELLAGPLAAAGGSVGVSGVLRLRRGARDSVGLDAAARTANLRDRVTVEPNGLPPSGAQLLLLDDVVTTGATLRGCRTALTSAGREVIGALVLCDATGAHGSRVTTPTPSR